MHTMNWDDLQSFVAVARAGHFLGASARLGVDRTTIGRRVSALEVHLGAPLFLRTRGGLRLTPAGEQTLVLAAQMEQAAGAIAAQREAQQQVKGLVRVALTEALGPFVIDQGLLSLKEEHPGLELELLAGSRRLDLGLGEADVGLRFDPLRGATLRARCVSRTAIGVYASPAYLRQRGVPKSARQLGGHDVLLPAAELSALPEARWLKRQPGTRVALASNSLPSLLAAALGGHGLVTLTDTWGAREPRLERLFAVPGLPPRALWLVTTAEGARRPAIAAVTRKLIQVLLKAQR